MWQCYQSRDTQRCTWRHNQLVSKGYLAVVRCRSVGLETVSQSDWLWKKEIYSPTLRLCGQLLETNLARWGFIEFAMRVLVYQRTPEDINQRSQSRGDIPRKSTCILQWISSFWLWSFDTLQLVRRSTKSTYFIIYVSTMGENGIKCTLMNSQIANVVIRTSWIKKFFSTSAVFIKHKLRPLFQMNIPTISTRRVTIPICCQQQNIFF